MRPFGCPDNYAGMCAGDLDQAAYDQLERAWPAAHEAVTELLLDIETGSLPEDTPELDEPLFFLIRERVLGVS
jgi:hypothetical protein